MTPLGPEPARSGFDFPPDRTIMATRAMPITVTLFESAKKSNNVSPAGPIPDEVPPAGRRAFL
jgi:hypothetical protein